MSVNTTVNVTTVLHSLDGKELPAGDQIRRVVAQVRGLIVQGDTQGAIELIDDVLVQTEPLTLRKVMGEALMQQHESDKNDTGEVKIERWKLAQKVYGPDEVELTTDEIVMAKDRIGKMYSAVVVGPAYALLDPASVGIDPTAIAEEAASVVAEAE